MNSFDFSADFSLGVATSATQIDGDCTGSNWYGWYLKGHIKDDSDPSITTMHRKYMKSDIDMMAEMGIKQYRFGLEWSRIEPEEGKFSEEEFDKIREELMYLRERGINPLVTLHHFSNPMWFEKKGGFLCRDYLKIFLRYVSAVIIHIGDLANEFITINEPNVYAVSAYLGGDYPPGKNNIFKTLKIMNRLGVCHRRAYEKIHEIREKSSFTDTKVGFAHHMRAFAPYNNKNPFHIISCKLSKYLFQGKISKTYLLGTGKDNGRFADFLAVNYYSRTASKGFEDNTFKNVPVNSLGWEIYPAGIAECCSELHSILPSLPIYITENGTTDIDDSFRTRYIYEHLKALCESGLPVTRYYHWCFVDNFEWLDGFTARFGLVYLDTKTMERKIKKSGEFFSEMIKHHGITEEMANAALSEEYRIV